MPTFDEPEKKKKKPLENSVRKEENAGNQHFLLFPQCFLLFTKQISNLQSLLFCRLQIHSIWTGLKYCHVMSLYDFVIKEPMDWREVKKKKRPCREGGIHS